MLMLGREEWGGRCILYVEDDESYTTFGDVTARGLARLPYRLAGSLSLHLLSYHTTRSSPRYMRVHQHLYPMLHSTFVLMSKGCLPGSRDVNAAVKRQLMIPRAG